MLKLNAQKDQGCDFHLVSLEHLTAPATDTDYQHRRYHKSIHQTEVSIRALALEL